MNNKTRKAIVFGFLFGVGMTWLLYLILIPVCGTGNFNRDFAKVFAHSEDIFQQSFIFGLFCAVMYWIISVCSQRRQAKKELEDEMLEYFHKQNEKEKDE